MTLAETPLTGEQLLYEGESYLPQAPEVVSSGLELRCEVCEIFGAVGVGKTQLALTLAASLAPSRRVLFVAVKDAPAALAQRLQCMAQDIGSLARVQLCRAGDFTDFARIILGFGESLQPKEPAPLVLLDGLSLLLAPFTSANGWAHRWRLAWSWRQLRQLALPGPGSSGCCVVLFSHLSGGPGGQVPALGALWSQGAARRLELRETELRPCARKRGPLSQEAPVQISVGEAGVHFAELAPPLQL
ncbi:unnamed protein product [Effrenium voratum]|nr:unnamed protein product [Effrenium voratum]